MLTKGIRDVRIRFRTSPRNPADRAKQRGWCHPGTTEIRAALVTPRAILPAGGGG